MEVEPENDSGDTAKNEESSSATKKTRQTRRDPNEEIPENWQRRMHLADKIPILKSKDAIEAETKRIASKDSESLSYSVSDFAFIEEPPLELNDSLREDLGASPPSFRVARLLAVSPTRVKINWLVRPSDVMFRADDTRELFLSFQTSEISVERLRGRCTVQCRSDIRNLSKYRERSAHFWYAKLYYAAYSKIYDIVPTLAMKSLSSRLLANLSLTATYGVIDPAHTKTLCDQPRKRKLQDDSEDLSFTESEIELLTARRAEWPFRYFDPDSREFCEPRCIPRTPRVDSEYQLEVDEWPGRPTAYYSAVLAEGSSSTELRFVEGHEESSPVDPDQPWAVEMPKGYIPRGGDATSTPVSLPLPGITEFVSKCQNTHAQNIEVKPSCLNFLDACCSIFVHSDSSANAFITVSRLSRKQLHEPELSPDELSAFRSAIDPFRHKTWHDVYRAVASKPIVELCQFYWVDFPLLPSVTVDRLLLGDRYSESPPSEEGRTSEVPPGEADTPVVCAICYTKHAPEWISLPDKVSLENLSQYGNSKIALCARCARLWYRYKSRWLAPTEVNRILELDESEGDGQSSLRTMRLDPDLIDDANCFFTESERREKRRQAAQEKREALVKRREELKVAKKAAKEAKKAGTEPTLDVQRLLESTAKAEPDEEGKVSAKTRTKTKAESKRKPTNERAEKSSKKLKTRANGDHKEAGKQTGTVKDDKTQNRAEDSSEEDTDVETFAKGKRKTQNASQMSLDQVDQILDAIDEELPPEAAEYPNYCVVCGQLDPSMPQRTCSSCGLNVHIACYGQECLSPAEYPRDSAVWFCDCCRNSRGDSQNDLSYQCLLCPPRTPCYGHWLNGVKTAAPDALKNTMEKTWCHVRCALFTPGVTFGSANELSDVEVSGMPSDAWTGHCAICMRRPPQARALTLPMQYGATSQTALSAQPKQGAATEQREASAPAAAQELASKSGLLETDQNSGRSPVDVVQKLSNNQDNSATHLSSSGVVNTDQPKSPAAPTSSGSSQRAQQTIQPDVLASMGAKVQCDLCEERFHVSCAADEGYQFGFTRDPEPRAVIVCSKHKHVDLVPMSRLDLNLNLTAAQLYVSSRKKAQRRFATLSDRCEWNRRLEPCDAIVKAKQRPLVLPILEASRSRSSEQRECTYEWTAQAEKLGCQSCGIEHASYWHADPQGQAVSCPMCYCNFEPVNVSSPTNNGSPSWKASFVDKLFSGLEAAQTPAHLTTRTA